MDPNELRDALRRIQRMLVDATLDRSLTREVREQAADAEWHISVTCHELTNMLRGLENE